MGKLSKEFLDKKREYRRTHPPSAATRANKSEWMRKRREKVPAKWTDRDYMRTLKKHNLTKSEYDALYEKQGGVCAICKLPETGKSWKGERLRRLSIDHEHSTGRVRGLLCSKCNRGIGFMNDNADRLRAAAAYVSVQPIVTGT